jgi:hypothetical protein
LTSGRNALKADIEAWLDNNGGGTVTVSFDRNIGKVRIACTTAVLVRARLNGINFWGGMCGKTCDYTFSIAQTHFVGLYINDKFWYSAANPLAFSTQSNDIKTTIENILQQALISGVVTVNTNGTITIADTNGSIGRATGNNGPNQAITHYSATQSNCVDGFLWPTLNLTINGCQGNQTITWRYRPVPGSGQWTTIQTGGLSLFTCAYGEYQALVSCGGCDYDDEYEFIIIP